MKLPTLTHLQFLTVGILSGPERAGRDLRAELKSNKVEMSGPAFYQMMARLEDAGLVHGRYETTVADGQTIRERWYTISREGKKAYEASCKFYLERTKPREREPGAVAARHDRLYGLS